MLEPTQWHPRTDRVMVIAEIGVNHNGDVAQAHALIDAAAATGADAVKFQTFDPAQLVSETARAAEYQSDRLGSQRQMDVIARLALPLAAWQELRAHADELGVLFASTAFDLASLDLVESLGVPLFKVPSGEVTNLPFIREIAGRGRPVLLSTGMANLQEIADAVAAASGAPSLTLLHCVSAYPTPIAEANLSAISTLRDEFHLPVGWSDHTVGSTSAIMAVALGAMVIEKHFTLDRNADGPDHLASMEPDAFASFVASIRDATAALGDGVKRCAPSEFDVREVARRSWHATRALPAGHRLAADDIVALRPGTGIPPSIDLTGRIVRSPIEGGAVITDDLLEPTHG